MVLLASLLLSKFRLDSEDYTVLNYKDGPAHVAAQPYCSCVPIRPGHVRIEMLFKGNVQVRYSDKMGSYSSPQASHIQVRESSECKGLPTEGFLMNARFTSQSAILLYFTRNAGIFNFSTCSGVVYDNCLESIYATLTCKLLA